MKPWPSHSFDLLPSLSCPFLIPGMTSQLGFLILPNCFQLSLILDSWWGMLSLSLPQIRLVPTSHLTAGRSYSQVRSPSCGLMSAAALGTGCQEEHGCFRLHLCVQGRCFGLRVPYPTQLSTAAMASVFVCSCLGTGASK